MLGFVILFESRLVLNIRIYVIGVEDCLIDRCK